MTAKEMIKELQKYPENMDVYVGQRVTEFGYGLVNSVYVKEIGFSEEPGEELEAFEKVIVIDEE